MNEESRRIEALRLYAVLDTATEQAFDDLTRLAANICQKPISLVSLVDKERQWFKSRHGLDATETPRDHAFCAHTIQSDKIMVVEDAHNDRRFASNPLVTGSPNIRFYAGAPLIVEDGQRLGTLCVIGRKPAKLSEGQIETLRVLGEAVVAQLELRKVQHDLRALEHLVPVCAWCQSVRVIDAGGGASWVPLGEYIHATVPETHGICPDCSGIHGVKPQA